MSTFETMRGGTGAVLMLLSIVVPVMSGALVEGTQDPQVPQEIPTAGQGDPKFEGFDERVVEYMAQRDIHAAVLAVAYGSDVLWTKGYGTMQRPSDENPDPDQVPPDALFRIASVTKPITAAAVRALVLEGALTYNHRVFCMDQDLPPYLDCVLEPGVAVADARHGDITIRHLLDHRGGWDRDVSGDPMFRSIEIAQELGVSSPAGKKEVMEYMLQRPLDHDPGTYYAYSNYGYLLLGLVIEEVTGGSYMDHVHDAVFSHVPGFVAAGPADIEPGRTLVGQRDPREPAYNCDGGWTAPNVFDPDEHVCWADGGWYLEAMEAHGGLVATAQTLASFATRYHWDGQPAPERTVPMVSSALGQGAWFWGSLDGTLALLRWHPSGLSYAVMFNQRADVDDHPGLADYSYYEIRPMLDEAADRYAQEHLPL